MTLWTTIKSRPHRARHDVTLQKDQSVIARHINNALKEGELEENSNMHFLHNTIRGIGTLIHAKELYQLTCPS